MDSSANPIPDLSAGQAPASQGHRIALTNPSTGSEHEDMEPSIPARFEQQVRAYPQRLALKTSTHEFTYNQLNQVANRVAHAILARRGDMEEPVALLIGDRATAIVAVFAALKARKAYAPLDPSLPPSRLTQILDDLQASLLLTDRADLPLARRLAGEPIQLIDIDDLPTSLSEEDANLSIPPDSFANILYTSGSTGQPKGVVQTHRNLLRHYIYPANDPLRHTGERVLVVGSVTASKSAAVLFGVLLNGATLVPFDLPREGLTRLSTLLTEGGIAAFSTVPTVFRHFAATLTGREDFSSVRLVRLGGEVVLRKDVELYRQHFPPGCLLRVGLSSTETLGITQYFIDHETPITDRTVPVGRPRRDIQILLVDENGREVGFDTVGEILVKGRYLSPGYWRRPELTAAVFAPDPAGGDARLYRMGDLGRMRPDGCLEYMGRRDEQVKIRGLRVEVAEVEMALLETNGVKEATVTACEGRLGDKELVGYVVGDPQAHPTVSELRDSLGKKLPDYMVPSAFVFLDALPLTPTGKVDRRALPKPGSTPLSRESAFVAPRNPVERQLAAIWEELLGTRPIGIRDNFFELGGHSMLAIRLFAQIEKAFGKKLPFAALFQSPTVEKLALMIRQEGPAPEWSTLVPIQPQGSKPPFFCVHGIGGGVMGYAELARLLGPDQPFYGLQAQGLDGVDKPHTTIEEMAAHYIEAMREVQPTGPYHLGGYCYGGIVAFEAAHQLRARGEPVALLAILEGSAPRRSQTHERLRPRTVLSFLRNLPYWLRDHGPEGYGAMGTRARRRARRVWRSLTRSQDASVPPVVLEDYFPDISQIPEAYRDAVRGVMEVEVRAKMNYQPSVYPGRVTLFRVRRLPLFRAHDPELGWGKLAAEGVEVKMIAGAHFDFLEPPHVQVLATQLKASLAQAQAMDQSNRSAHREGGR